MIRQSAALLHRALRVDARLIRSHFFRITLLAFLVFLLFNAQGSLAAGSPGLEYFGLIHLCDFWFITFAGITFFATSITEEKEEQTLGLLKMAGISPLTLVVGKWAPRVIGGVLLLTVQLPFTLLAITLGGVLWDQVIAAYCAQLAHLVLVGCVGLFASVVWARSTGACVATALILLALFAMPPLVLSIAGVLSARGVLPTPAGDALETVCAQFVQASALTRLSEIQLTRFSGPPAGFQVVSNVAAGAVFFVLSWRLFEVCTRNECPTADGWWIRMSRWGRRPSRRVWDAALLWKDFFYSAGGTRVLLLKLIGYSLLVIAIGTYVRLMSVGKSIPVSAVKRELGGSVMGLMLFLLFIEGAMIAARCFRTEITQRTWPLLCLLPRSVSEIAYRKVASHGLALLPAATYFWVGALLAPNSVINFLDAVFDDTDVFLAFVYAVSQFLWLMHVIALLSVMIDWAAWPVSIFCGGFAVFLWNAMFLSCVVDTLGKGPTDEVTFFMMCVFGCGQVAITHWLIGERLRILAGR